MVLSIKKWASGLCLFSSLVFSEQHFQKPQKNPEPLLLRDQVGFVRQSEVEPLEGSSTGKSIYREEGKLLVDTPFETHGLRVYLGNPGKPQGDLELYGVMAGRAKTFQAAKKICTGIPPLGKWKLASLVQVKAFFEELLPGFPVPSDPNQLGFLFWAESKDPKFDKKNQNTFFTTPKGADPLVETQVYTEFINRVRRIHAQSKTASEKEYANRFLEFLKEGIPVICVFGEG